MRVLVGTILMLCAASLAAAGEWKHGLELQGGMGHWSAYEFPGVDLSGVDFRWRPAFGLGAYVEHPVGAGLTLGAGLAYRLVGDEVRDRMESSGTRYEFRSRVTVQQLTLPVRLEHAVPGVPALSVEVGAQAEYVLKAMEKYETESHSIAPPATRAVGPLTGDAVIFEALKDEYEITGLTQRLGAAGSAGAAWRTRLGGRDAALAGRFEFGLTEAWKNGLERFARRATLSLRVEL